MPLFSFTIDGTGSLGGLPITYNEMLDPFLEGGSVLQAVRFLSHFLARRFSMEMSDAREMAGNFAYQFGLAMRKHGLNVDAIRNEWNNKYFSVVEVPLKKKDSDSETEYSDG